ncbi:MAG: dephospho-CoA kinase [Bacteroidota bacterium]
MTPSSEEIFLLGVTGGIGSGKSMVCRFFAERGAHVVYADAAAKALMVSNEAVRADIIEAFGKASYHADGSLNRAHLASQVFGDDAAVARINSIVHPRMADVLIEARDVAMAAGKKLLVYEAALIYESGSADRLDAVAVVHTPLVLRLQRVMARDEATEAQVKKRMDHQLPPETLLEKADYVLHNDGSIAHLEAQVDALYHTILQLQNTN